MVEILRIGADHSQAAWRSVLRLIALCSGLHL